LEVHLKNRKIKMYYQSFLYHTIDHKLAEAISEIVLKILVALTILIYMRIIKKLQKLY